MLIREEALENMKNAFSLYKEEFGEEEDFYFPHISLAFRSVEKQREIYDKRLRRQPSGKGDQQITLRRR